MWMYLIYQCTYDNTTIVLFSLSITHEVLRAAGVARSCFGTVKKRHMNLMEQINRNGGI